ncbi:MAG: MASE1 domain-containing protein [Novosphingobium sp.]|uniref:MASE1 domain-containing protein n=1 Tax=Novosphingobium sp. TaxID=1874826 RepID=UPI003B9AE0DF
MRIARLLACPAGVSLTYFALAAGSIAFGRFTGGVAMAWIASAVLAGRLLHLPEHRWMPWLVGSGIASFIATGLWGFGWLAAFPFAIINILEAIGAAIIWRRITKAFWPYETLEWIASFYVGIGLTIPLLSGGAAASTAWVVHGQPVIDNFTRWIIGHSLGLLACLPVFHFIYGRLGRGRSFLPPRDMLPLTALVVGTFVLLTVTVFSLDMRALLVFPLVYLVVCSATVPSAILTQLPLLLIMIGGGMTVAGMGPIAGMDWPMGDRVQFFQLYIGVTVLTSLPLQCERAKRVLEMRKMRARIVELENQSQAVF